MIPIIKFYNYIPYDCDTRDLDLTTRRKFDGVQQCDDGEDYHLRPVPLTTTHLNLLVCTITIRIRRHKWLSRDCTHHVFFGRVIIPSYLNVSSAKSPT